MRCACVVTLSLSYVMLCLLPQVSVLLGEEANVFLVDVRPDEAREEEGLPQLKLQARFKVAAFPLLQVRQLMVHQNTFIKCYS